MSEVLRHLSETGAIYQDATGRWVAESVLEQLALPDSVRVVIGARVGRLGKDAGRVLSVASVIGRDFDLDLLARATKTSEDDLLDILDAAAAVALVRELADTGPLQLRPRPHPAHLVRGPRSQPTGTGAPAGGRSPGGPLRRSPRDAGGRTGPALDQCHPAHRPGQGHQVLPPGGRRRARAPWPPPTPSATTPRPSTSTPRSTTPIRSLGIDLAIGLGTAQRQTGDPAFARDPPRLRLAGPLTSVTPIASWPPPWPTTGVTSAPPVPSTPTRSRSWRWPSIGSRPTTLTGRSCSLPCVRNSSYGSPLERRQALADEALAIAESSGDDAIIVRVLNNSCCPSLVPSLHEQSLTRTADALVRAERVGDPVLLFFARITRDVCASLAGDIDEMDRCLDIMGSLAERLDQPTLSWTNTLPPRQASTDRRRYRPGRTVGHRGPANRHRLRTTRRLPLLRYTAHRS